MTWGLLNVTKIKNLPHLFKTDTYSFCWKRRKHRTVTRGYRNSTGKTMRSIAMCKWLFYVLEFFVYYLFITQHVQLISKQGKRSVFFFEHTYIAHSFISMVTPEES